MMLLLEMRQCVLEIVLFLAIIHQQVPELLVFPYVYIYIYIF